jgi:hypothetical protein
VEANTERLVGMEALYRAKNIVSKLPVEEGVRHTSLFINAYTSISSTKTYPQQN